MQLGIRGCTQGSARIPGCIRGSLAASRKKTSLTKISIFAAYDENIETAAYWLLYVFPKDVVKKISGQNVQYYGFTRALKCN